MLKSKGQKTVMGILICVLLVTIFVMSFNRYYSRSAYVSEVKGDVIQLIDGRGHIWEWEKEKNESFNLGEKVLIKFDNNKTDEEVTDDIIISIEKTIKNK